jgi:hypothetical protein
MPLGSIPCQRTGREELLLSGNLTKHDDAAISSVT